jgi:hypothetical protein
LNPGRAVAASRGSSRSRQPPPPATPSSRQRREERRRPERRVCSSWLGEPLLHFSPCWFLCFSNMLTVFC